MKLTYTSILERIRLSLASNRRIVRFAHLLIFTDRNLFYKFQKNNFVINNQSFNKVRKNEDGVFRDYISYFLLYLLKSDCTQDMLFAGISHGVLIQSLLSSFKERRFARHIYLLDPYDKSIKDGSTKKLPSTKIASPRKPRFTFFLAKMYT